MTTVALTASLSEAPRHKEASGVMKDQYRKFYDQLAEDVLDRGSRTSTLRDFLHRYWDMREIDVVRRLIRVNTEGYVLDVACGPGRWIIEYASQGPQVIGIDISPKMIKLAKSKMQKIHNTDFVCGDAENMPFRNDVFDVVSCFDAFGGFPHPVKSLREMKRALKKEGILVVEPTNILSLMGIFIATVRQFYCLFRKFLKRNLELAWYDRWTRYEFPTRFTSWLQTVGLTYKMIGVNILPTLPHRSLLDVLLRIERELEKHTIFNVLGYRLIFICNRGHT